MTATNSCRARSLPLLPAIAFLASLAGPMATRAATGPETAFTEFNRACVQTHRNADSMICAWWLPLEYWRKAAALDPNTTQTDLNDILDAFRPYLVLGIVQMKGNITTSVRYASEFDLRQTTRLSDKSGTIYAPIHQSDLQDAPKEVFRLMKPGMIQHMGEMGKHMHFLFFPATDTLGRRIADATKPGRLSLRVGTEEFVWDLPLIPDRRTTGFSVAPSDSFLSRITAQQARGLGESVGKIGGGFVSAAYFGLYATAEGYTKSSLTKKKATALVKRFGTDARTVRDELDGIPALLGESEDTDDYTGGLRKSINSLIKQADFLGSYIELGNRRSLESYQRERDAFLDLMRNL